MPQKTQRSPTHWARVGKGLWLCCSSVTEPLWLCSFVAPCHRPFPTPAHLFPIYEMASRAKPQIHADFHRLQRQDCRCRNGASAKTFRENLRESVSICGYFWFGLLFSDRLPSKRIKPEHLNFILKQNQDLVIPRLHMARPPFLIVLPQQLPFLSIETPEFEMHRNIPRLAHPRV